MCNVDHGRGGQQPKTRGVDGQKLGPVYHNLFHEEAKKKQTQQKSTKGNRESVDFVVLSGALKLLTVKTTTTISSRYP